MVERKLFLGAGAGAGKKKQSRSRSKTARLRNTACIIGTVSRDFHLLFFSLAKRNNLEP